MPRHTVPERCDRPAIGFANAYRFCDEHVPPGIIWESDYNGRCDYPMDGLGAARMAIGGA
jgi:hypothetical protein